MNDNAVSTILTRTGDRVTVRIIRPGNADLVTCPQCEYGKCFKNIAGSTRQLPLYQFRCGSCGCIFEVPAGLVDPVSDFERGGEAMRNRVGDCTHDLPPYISRNEAQNWLDANPGVKKPS